MRMHQVAFIAMFLATNAGAVSAQERGAQGTAYSAAMKCFVANGHAMGMRRRAGDEAKAAYYETKARLSFDTAVKLGQALGFSGSRINQDLGLAQARELPPMVSDDRYFKGNVAACKSLGLM